MSLAYWCVLAAALLPYFTVAVAKAVSPYDNRNPRRAGLYKGLAFRAHSAHQNGFEAFPFFAVAVLVASHGNPQAGLPLLNILSGIWLVLRISHAAAYIGDKANLRSLVWMAAFFLTVAIFTMPVWHG